MFLIFSKLCLLLRVFLKFGKVCFADVMTKTYTIVRVSLKLVCAISLTNFYFSPNDSPSKTMKDAFYFI